MTSPAAQLPPPPEARLIRLAREAQGLSPEVAASKTPLLGGSRWRQVEAGYRGKDRVPVIGKAHVIAHMARIVGVTADRLEEVGRTDAAEVLREIELQDTRREPAPPTRDDLRERLIETNMRLAHTPADHPAFDGLLAEVFRLVAELNRLKDIGRSHGDTAGGRRTA